MQYPLLPHPSEGRDRTHPVAYSRSRDIRNGHKNIPQNSQARYLYRLEIVFQILYKKVHRNYYTCFKKLKTVLENTSFQDNPLEKLFRQRLDRLMNILKANALKMEAVGFYQIKEHIQAQLFLKRANYVLTRMALRNLATSSRLVKFKHLLTCVSKKSRLHQKSIKARYFMAVCENIISKNNIPKELYKSFREWHLRSVLEKLSGLSEVQKERLCQQKEIAARHIRNCITKIFSKAFYQLKQITQSNEYISEKLSYSLSLNDLIEKISAPFLKHSLLLYPRANWDSSNMDTPSLLKVCQFFKKLSSYATPKTKGVQDKLRGALILSNVIHKKMLSDRNYVFKHLNLLFVPAASVTKTIRKKSVKQNNVNVICNVIRKLVNKTYISAFHKIGSADSNKQSTVLRNIKVQHGLNILERVNLKSHHKLETTYLFSRGVEVIDKARTLKLKRMKNIICNYLNDHMKRAFYRLAENVIETTEVQEEKLDTRNDEQEITSEKRLLLDMIKNQAIINSKLEKSHQKKNATSNSLIHRYQQQSIVASVIFKDNLRVCHNEEILRKCLRVWHSTCATDNLQENAFTVLQNEIDVFNAEIQQIEQRKMEEAAQYLEWLEYDSSKLKELIDRLEFENQEEVTVYTLNQSI